MAVMMCATRSPSLSIYYGAGIYVGTCVAAHDGGPVFVAAAGGGGGISAFSRSDASQLIEARLEGGAWHPVAVRGTDHVAAACGRGLVIAKARGQTAAPEVTPIEGVRSLVDAGEAQIALLCGEPAPGIRVIQIERA
jgi:hypothetical protein